MSLFFKNFLPLKKSYLPLVIFLPILTSCAKEIKNIEEMKVDFCPDLIFIPDVPFYPQSSLLCGPVALAIVFAFWGYDIPIDQISKDIYRDDHNGTLSLDMMLYARQCGFEANIFNGSFALLKEELAKGNPLILMFKITDVPQFPIKKLSLKDQFHFVVATGFCPSDGSLICHSGEGKNIVVPHKLFNKLWRKTNYWTLKITPQRKD